MVSASRRGFPRLSRVLPTSRVFTSGYVNTETILRARSLVLTPYRENLETKGNKVVVVVLTKTL